MSDRQLRDEAVTLLVAGHETTAVALAWTCWLLARHPEAAAKAASEADAILGDHWPRPPPTCRVCASARWPSARRCAFIRRPTSSVGKLCGRARSAAIRFPRGRRCS